MFDFEPKFVIAQSKTDSQMAISDVSGYTIPRRLVYIDGMDSQYSGYYYGYANSLSKITFTKNGNTLSWYSNDKDATGGREAQCNANKIYCWIAIY